MAWSDAARAAALEARRMHAHGNVDRKAYAFSLRAARYSYVIGKLLTIKERNRLAKVYADLKHAPKLSAGPKNLYKQTSYSSNTQSRAVYERQNHQFSQDIGGSSSNYRSPYFGSGK